MVGGQRHMLNRLRRRFRHRDEGFALVIYAVTLILLMTMVAFAVDLGLVYTARRQDQNAADAAALGGAQELLNGNAAVATQVQDIVYSTLELNPGDLDFNSCTGDSGALPFVVSGMNCITRNGSGRLLRVKVPLQEIEAVFGAVAGRERYEHTAFAIAGVVRQGHGGVLPFALFTSASGHACLRTDNPSTPMGPCQGSETGDTGILNFTFFGDEELGTTTDCVGNGSAARVANNVAVGVDHILRLSPVLGGTISDGQMCGDQVGEGYPQNKPDVTDTNNTAGASQGLANGLFRATGTFSDGSPARLQRAADVPYDERQTVESHEVDSTPLWKFIADAATTTEIPDQCERQVFTDALANVTTLPTTVESHLSQFSVEVRMEKLLERCFDLYVDGTWDDGGAIPTAETRTGCSAGLGSPCTGVLFGRNTQVQSPEIWDIQLSPRFAYVPEAWEALGSNTISFKTFRPIFIQRLCMGNQLCNNGTFSPGVDYADQQTNVSNDNVSAISAFAFHANMLPGRLGSPNAPFEINVNMFLRLVR